MTCGPAQLADQPTNRTRMAVVFYVPEKSTQAIPPLGLSSSRLPALCANGASGASDLESSEGRNERGPSDSR